MPNNNPNGGAQWLESHCAELTRLLETGLVYHKIAESLNAQFGTAYSKNAVVGKVCRLGLTPPDKPKRPPYVRKTSHKSKGIRAYVARRTTHNSNAMRLSPVIDLEQMRCVEIAPQHVSLLELTGCAYPYGDGPFTFCNHAKMAGSSYCAPHKFLCWVPPRPALAQARIYQGTNFARGAA